MSLDRDLDHYRGPSLLILTEINEYAVATMDSGGDNDAGWIMRLLTASASATNCNKRYCTAASFHCIQRCSTRDAPCSAARRTISDFTSCSSVPAAVVMGWSIGFNYYGGYNYILRARWTNVRTVCLITVISIES